MPLSLYDLNNDKASKGLVTNIQHGLMSAQDKAKLDNIENFANNYVHPLTHDVTEITGLATVAATGSYNDLLDKPTGVVNADTVDNMHASDFAPIGHVGVGGDAHSTVTISENGFMSSADKIKLNEISPHARLVQPSIINGDIKIDGVNTTVYTHPTHHGNITVDGAIGTLPFRPVITTYDGVLDVGSFGSTEYTFCQGNDYRLLNARTPLAHNHGNIGNDGAIGTESGKAVVTSTDGILAAGILGIIAGGTGATTKESALINLGIYANANELNILDGTSVTTNDLNMLHNVTATASELNILDGATVTTNEINILDGLSTSTNELNILHGVTANTNEINILDGIVATTSELNVLHGITASTSEINILDGIVATTSELNALDNVTDNVQKQLDYVYNNAMVDVRKILYHPNKCANSSFELFKADLTPYYWNTAAVVSKDAYFNNEYSLKLMPTQVAIQTAENGIGLWDPSWWDWTANTRISFRAKGTDNTGKIKIEVLNAGNTLQILTYRTYNPSTKLWNTITGVSYIEFATGASWGDAFKTLTVQCSAAGFHRLRFTNTGSIDVYLDAITIEGDNNTDWPSIYTPGVKSNGAADINGHKLFMTNYDPSSIAEDGDVWIDIS